MKTEDGLLMISRFWLGETMKNPLLRKLVITENMAKGMAEHLENWQNDLWHRVARLLSGGSRKRRDSIRQSLQQRNRWSYGINERILKQS